jgi:hypothetical protein
MWIRHLFVICFALIAACGQGPEPEAPASESSAPAAAPETETQAPALARKTLPDGAMAYIISPADGATVTSPVHVVFGLSGAGVTPAGVAREDAGHHHLLIDTEVPSLDLPIPNDANHRHFGGGQTEAEIELAPGSHTLQLLLGDELHVPHNPPLLSDRITIEVR